MKPLHAVLPAFCAALISSQPVAAAEIPETAITAIQSSLPDGWQIARSQTGVLPFWSLSEDRCTEVTIVGPNRTGYRYLNASGGLVREHLFQREAITLWIAEPEYDPGLNLGRRLTNRFRVNPIEFPHLIYDRRFKVYGVESLFAKDFSFADKPPPGAISARHLGLNRSWPDWRGNLAKAFAASPAR